MQPATYILASQTNAVIYIGVTNDLKRRVFQHKCKQISGFTEKYNVTKLVYFELHHTMYDAITREKRLKNWKRAWKNDLIETSNKSWADLYESIL